MCVGHDEFNKLFLIYLTNVKSIVEQRERGVVGEYKFSFTFLKLTGNLTGKTGDRDDLKFYVSLSFDNSILENLLNSSFKRRYTHG